jgi:3-methyladenine DNA glycosylase AlkD
METILTKIRRELTSNIDEKYKTGSQNFFKGEIKNYGVRNGIVHKISRKYYAQIKIRPKADIFDLCEKLWQSGYIEESIVACNWSYYIHRKYEPPDFDTFEKWIGRYVSNWATCDTLCNHTIGVFVDMYPEFLTKLKEFTKSDNRWMRRASAVSLIMPARKGKFLNDIKEISDLLLSDKDDMVQKGYGWMLKAASESHQKEIFDYVVMNKAVMPRTALRYAIEKMPVQMKSIAMER